MCVCVCERERVCVCERERERERERDQVFIGNQREQLQKEPAEARSSHINPGGDAMRWALREHETGVVTSSAIN